MINVMPSKSIMAIIIFLIGFCGWAVISLLLWLVSFVTINII